MHPEEVIRAHSVLCDEANSLMLEENRVIRETGAAPDESFLKRKQALLPKLDESLERLKSLRESGAPISEPVRRQIEIAQKKLMKIFMLDRENEQLLLKASLPMARMGSAPVVRRGNPQQARKAYQNG